MRKKVTHKIADVRTADGEVFNTDKRYWFYEPGQRQVRTTIGLRSDGEYLCSFGLKVVPIRGLRDKKRDAVADGRLGMLDEVKEIEMLMESLG